MMGRVHPLAMIESEAPHICGQNCCHWSLPLELRRITTIEGVDVALSYEQWLVYHLHVVIHQGGLKMLSLDPA